MAEDIPTSGDTADGADASGGARAPRRSFPTWPHFDEDEISAVAEVLRSGRVNYWTGPLGREFESAFAEFVGRRRAIALSNGTAALELALWAFGIGEGDDVVVPARTFIATASAVATRGARPVVADVDRDSGCVTAETIAAALTPATKAIVVVHLGGWPCDMAPIAALARERGLRLIEDCAQALGASYAGASVGTFCDAAAFSFCQDKIMTTGGEGGMLVMDDEALFELAWSLKDHGKSYAASVGGGPASTTSFRWLVDRFGTSMRMTEMQAAIGLVGLGKVPAWVEMRRWHALRLETAFAGMPGLRVTVPPEGSLHAYYKYYAYVRPENLAAGWDRDRVCEAVAAEGVPCYSGACPEIYLERAFDGIRPSERLPVARELGETSLMFLVHPTLSDDDMSVVASAVTKVMRDATA
jgi:dTDP-4-amino-4,6-dideoxygalactose transaminase